MNGVIVTVSVADLLEYGGNAGTPQARAVRHRLDELADKLRAVDTRFVIEPHVRFKGQVGEQATMFFLDPSGNALEFKAFGDLSQVFAK